MLLNFCAEESRWEDADGVRKLLDEKGLRKMATSQKCSSKRRWFFFHIKALTESNWKTDCKEIFQGGILEVLLVNAKDIRHTSRLGSPAYYVMVECGNHEHRTKVSSGKHEYACWNEKFSFELPSSDWKKINHIKFRIIETKLLNNESVGATVIHIGGIISEGYERGFIEVSPAPYNVVLEEDDTYKGEIKIGFKFFTKEEIGLMEAREFIGDGKQPRKPICSKALNIWRTVWLKLLYLIGHNNSSTERRQQ